MESLLLLLLLFFKIVFVVKYRVCIEELGVKTQKNNGYYSGCVVIVVVVNKEIISDIVAKQC